MRSLYSGVSGLQNHQIRMDVIGNNISNVNTTGFKKGRVNFQDLLSQRLQGAARPNERIGGINPQQIGLGMQVASIDTIHLQGSMQTTGVKTDLALEGEGFFIMRSGSEEFYTRAGAFGLDAEGVLVNPANGMRVQGWQAEVIDGNVVLNPSGETGDLVIPIGGKDPARATTQVFLASNLDKNTPLIPAGATLDEIREGTWTVSREIYDQFGNNHLLQVDYTRVADQPNTWTGTVTINPGSDAPIAPLLSIGGVEVAPGAPAEFEVLFDNVGNLAGITNGAGGADVEGDLTIDVTFEVPETNAPVDPDLGIDLGDNTQTFSINIGAVGILTNDQPATTQYAEQSTNRMVSSDGYGMGYLNDFVIDANGIITGIYSNGTNRALGQVAVASFINPGGLEKVGETAFSETINSGQVSIGAAGTEGRGTLRSGALEMSNVDLSEQFTDMIVTQRGFQANSRTITTSDQMLQEVLGLKR